jgi:hypothetical protein
MKLNKIVTGSCIHRYNISGVPYFCAKLCQDRPDDGGSTHHWNVNLLQQDFTALYPRRLSSSSEAKIFFVI